MRGYIPLKNTKIFQKPVSVKKIMNELDFIKRKDKYGLYFQGGIRKIEKKYYDLIAYYGQE